MYQDSQELMESQVILVRTVAEDYQDLMVVMGPEENLEYLALG